MQVLAVNVGGRLGSKDELRAQCNLATHTAPNWCAMFVSESDVAAQHQNDHNYSCAHIQHRHHPGKGSRAMRWIIRAHYSRAVRKCVWRGRCGAIHIHTASTNIYAIGLHAAHGDGLPETLRDVAVLAKGRPWGARLLILGDWNVDLLPSHSADPFAGHPGRGDRHAFERRWLEALASALRLEVTVPARCIDSPGGRWAEDCLGTPVTRVPQGQAPGLPSLLDYALSSPALIHDLWSSWAAAPGDHAMIVAEVTAEWEPRKWAKTCWACKDEEGCKLWLAKHADRTPTDMTSFQLLMLTAQSNWSDNRTCKQRSKARLPPFVAEALALAAATDDEQTSSNIRAAAWTDLRQHTISQRTAQLEAKAKAGGAIATKKKLHKISALLVDGKKLNDALDWGEHIAKVFEDKWGSTRLQLRHLVLDRCMEQEGSAIKFTENEIPEAVKKIRKRGIKDRGGVSVSIIALWASACPRACKKWFAAALASTAIMSGVHVEGKCLGKMSPVTEVKDIRAVLPMPAFLQVADVLVSNRLHTFIDTCLPVPAGAMVSARPKTQGAEVSFAVQLAVEKSLDNGSKGAIAQCDVQAHYDTVSGLKITNWLNNKGADRAVTTTALRMQLVCKVSLQSGAMNIVIGNRSNGSLTGSRVAGAWGRVPVETTIAKRNNDWKRQGWQTTGETLTVATYVDNLFALGRDADAAIDICNDFGKHLAADWGQKIKPSSKQLLVPKGGQLPKDAAGWEICTCFNVLGNSVQHNAETDKSWETTKSAVRRAWFATVKKEGARELSLAANLRLMNTTIKPLVMFKTTGMPFGKTRADQISRLQRSLVQQVLKLPRLDEEEAAAYQKRKHTATTAALKTTTDWRQATASRTLQWHEHNTRNNGNRLWAAELIKVTTAAELAEVRKRRQEHGLPGLGRRAWPGHVATRWEQSVVNASATVALHKGPAARTAVNRATANTQTAQQQDNTTVAARPQHLYEAHEGIRVESHLPHRAQTQELRRSDSTAEAEQKQSGSRAEAEPQQEDTHANSRRAPPQRCSSTELGQGTVRELRRSCSRAEAERKQSQGRAEAEPQQEEVHVASRRTPPQRGSSAELEHGRVRELRASCSRAEAEQEQSQGRAKAQPQQGEVQDASRRAPPQRCSSTELDLAEGQPPRMQSRRRPTEPKRRAGI